MKHGWWCFFVVALSYLWGPAHEWWVVYQSTGDGRKNHSWSSIRSVLSHRYDTLNEKKLVRDKPAKWKQMKDVPRFDGDLLGIILDFLNMSLHEQTDKNSRRLKPCICKELCTSDYETLAEIVRVAECLKSTSRHRTFSKVKMQRLAISVEIQRPLLMELGTIKLKKLSKEDRERCMRERLCADCRQKEHLAKNCPKARRSWIDSLEHFQACMIPSACLSSFWMISSCPCLKWVSQEPQYLQYFKDTNRVWGL